MDHMISVVYLGPYWISLELFKRLKYGDLKQKYTDDVLNSDQFERDVMMSAVNVICGNIEIECASAINSLSNFYLPTEYTFAENSWGNLYYKIYTTPLNYDDAKAQCESDGTSLAYPRSGAENEFLAGLVPNEHIWIGINDIEEEGLFVGVDGREINWTSWNHNEPNNWMGEDGAVLTNSGGWIDIHLSSERVFVCSINSEGKIVSLKLN